MLASIVNFMSPLLLFFFPPIWLGSALRREALQKEYPTNEGTSEQKLDAKFKCEWTLHLERGVGEKNKDRIHCASSCVGSLTTRRGEAVWGARIISGERLTRVNGMGAEDITERWCRKSKPASLCASGTQAISCIGTARSFERCLIEWGGGAMVVPGKQRESNLVSRN